MTSIVDQQNDRIVNRHKMNSSDPILIHIGYHKTATSWLQKCIFSREDMGFLSPWTVTTGEAIQHFVIANEFRFDATRARHAFQGGMDNAIERSLMPVLSHQDLCGYAMYGRYYGRVVAERLYQSFPGARILIGIREQKSMLLSQYRQYLRQDGVHSLDAFIGTGDERAGFAPIFRLDHLEYDLLVEHYQRLFGRANVLVMPIELLYENPNQYVEQILDFCGSPQNCDLSYPSENVGWGGLALTLRRRLNRICPADPLGRKPHFLNRALYKSCEIANRLIPQKLHKAVDRRWKQAIERRVGHDYRLSNQRLEKLTGTNLTRFGYEL
jgi:hypothetical protein